ncbi:MAG: thioredoxin domain-containing protein [Planctomycetota bacterium]
MHPANRLVHEQSPYLLQHAHNPVDWYPWSEEAFARARALDLPVFLSVGYATCHWCHVMERESFESESIAAILNANYVPIKVDREERPDLDEIYMKATQLLTRRGGWPNSVWLTPDGRPWYAGTYFPPESRQGQLGFRALLERLSETWKTRRADVEQHAEQLAQGTRELSQSEAWDGPVEPRLIEAAVQQLKSDFDPERGGFGTAPKFPPHGGLALLASVSATLNSAGAEIERMVRATLDAMANGGIHDHLGGGFHRYSTDAEWLVPHFEKMLYDNAQLARAYADWSVRLGEVRYAQVARDICEWVLVEMRDPLGGFYSAQDADSEGEEGKFYVWRRSDVLAALGAEDGARFCATYRIEEGGNFVDEATGVPAETNIPHLLAPIAVADAPRLRALRAELYAVRRRRVPPFLDDKILAGWNGLMIGSLAFVGHTLREPRFVAAACAAADFVLTRMTRDGVLLRSYRAGSAHVLAYLEDHAFLADGLLGLVAAGADGKYLESARWLMRELETRFVASNRGGYFTTSNEHEVLLVRAQDCFDQAVPSGNGVAARVLLRLGALTREPEYFDRAGKVLAAFGGAMARHPRGTEALLCATADYLARVGVKSKRNHFASVSADAERTVEGVTVQLYAERLVVTPASALRWLVRLELPRDHWIGIAVSAANEAHGTRLALSLAPDAETSLSDVEWQGPPAERTADSGEPAWFGRVDLYATARLRQTAVLGPRTLECRLRFQLCGEGRCQPAREVTLLAPILVVTEADRGVARFPEFFSE